MKKNLLKGLVLGASVMMLFSACVKDNYSFNQAAGQGPSYVRITEAKVYNQFFAPFTTVNPITMFSVRRDASGSDALQATNLVQLTDITSTYLSTYNTKNGTNYSSMPSTLYTFSATSDASVTATSTGYNFNFGPGDFAKNLVFNVNGAQVDLSKQYAIAFTITNTGGLTRKAGLDTILATVAIKNKYDGVYRVQLGSTMTDVTSTVYSHINNLLSVYGTSIGLDNLGMQYQLRTTSANTCALYDNYFFVTYDTPICTGTASSNYSYWGSFSPVFTFDLTTDKVTAVTNYYGQPASNTRAGRLDPSGSVNGWVSGTFTIKYDMTQSSVVTTAPYVRVIYDEVWKYIGSR